MCSHHNPLTEGRCGVLIHTHIVPFGQLTVCDKNEASCFEQKHNGFIQELEVFFGAVDRRRSVGDCFLGDPCGKRRFAGGASSDDHDILYAVAKVDLPDFFQLPPQTGGDPRFIEYFWGKAGRPVDVVCLFLCPQFRLLLRDPVQVYRRPFRPCP